MLTIRIKSENGTLKCEFTEMKKPNPNMGNFENNIYPNQYLQDWNNSFTELTLSEEAREYLNEKYLTLKHNLLVADFKFELSGKETECFEVKKDFVPVNHASGLELSGHPIMDKSINENYKYTLHLKSVPVAENVAAGDGMKNDFESQLIALGKELLKHKKEIYKTTMSDIAVQTKEFMIPVSEIIKAFDTLGISLESKTEF